MMLAKHAFRSRTVRGFVAAAALAVLPATAQAQLQLLGQSNQAGGGLGNVLTVLTLQNPGGTTTESGCVSPTGFANCGFPNANVQQGQSQVQPLTSLTGVTGSTFRLFLNASEPGNDNTIVVNDLVVTLYGSGNNTFSASFAGPQTLTNTLTGTGNYGFLFGLSPTSAAAFDAFIAANPNAVIGAGASFSSVSGGLETISVGRATGGGVQVPEPSPYLLLGSGLAGLLFVTLQRRRA
jgi:hypothetical protein